MDMQVYINLIYHGSFYKTVPVQMSSNYMVTMAKGYYSINVLLFYSSPTFKYT